MAEIIDSSLESPTKAFTTLGDLLLEDDGIAIVSIFTLTTHGYERFPDMVALARSIPKEMLLAAYKQFKEEWFVSDEFRLRLEAFVEQMQDIRKENIEEKYKKTFYKSLEEELGNFIFWENEWLFDKRIMHKLSGKGKWVPMLEIKNGQINFLLPSSGSEKTTSDVSSEIGIILDMEKSEEK